MIQFVESGPETEPKKKPKTAARVEAPGPVADEISMPQRAAKSAPRKGRRSA